MYSNKSCDGTNQLNNKDTVYFLIQIAEKHLLDKKAEY